ncbi:hypothetical protein PybrP1_005083, partial [[Pythium] brassicae (nom. inval.)]
VTSKAGHQAWLDQHVYAASRQYQAKRDDELWDMILAEEGVLLAWVMDNQLYVAAKKLAISHLNKARVKGAASFTMVVDFGTSNDLSVKSLRMRVFFADKDWDMRSILLEIQCFDSIYGEHARGIRGSFKVLDSIDGRGLWACYQRLLRHLDRRRQWRETDDDEGHRLQREWCLAHLLNAATSSRSRSGPRRQPRRRTDTAHGRPPPHSDDRARREQEGLALRVPVPAREDGQGCAAHQLPSSQVPRLDQAGRACAEQVGAS